MKIGILGAGQLGRMLALSGYPLGMEFRLYDPASEPCSKPLAETMQGEFEDYACLYKFLQHLDVVTYEFENVPVETALWLNERVPVYPPPEILAIAQDRIFEKNFFRSLGIPTPPYHAVQTESDLQAAMKTIGLPGVLKTTRFGYDGKGQAVVRTADEVADAWKKLSGRSLIYEGFVPFDREVSLLSVRNRAGECVFYPLVQNTHSAGILAKSQVHPDTIEAKLQLQAETAAREILEKVQYVGVLAIEWFQVGDTLYANEMAPRVHNSGHWSIEGALCSQFENHLRAVSDFPLGNTAVPHPTTMWNLIGQAPDVRKMLSIPQLHVHLYGKAPRAGRKIGHLTWVNHGTDPICPMIEELLEN